MGLWATNCFGPFLSGACSNDEKESEKDVRRAFGIRAVPRHQISDPRFYDVIATVRSTPAHESATCDWSVNGAANTIRHAVTDGYHHTRSL